jgi:cytochrome P450
VRTLTERFLRLRAGHDGSERRAIRGFGCVSRVGAADVSGAGLPVYSAAVPTRLTFPPGPRTPGMLALLQWMWRPTDSFERAFREYGDIYSIKNPLFGREVIVCHPELIRQIFSGDPDAFHAGEPARFLIPVVGDRSVLVLDGREHHRERKLLLPPFQGDRLSVYAAEMREIADRAIDAMPIGEVFSLLPHMQRLTFDVILRTVFGVRDGATIDVLRERLLALVDRIQSPRGMLFILPVFQGALGPLTGWSRFKRMVAAADEAIYRVIGDARAAGSEGGRSDVLSLLLAATDENGAPMTDQELRDELMTMLLAGHETTATALAWAVEEIVRRPEVLARIVAELGAAGARAGAPMPYLDATIKEVLRLRPLTPMILRRTTRPVRLREHELPAGTYVVINAYIAQRHPAIWDAPDELRPERFLHTKPDPYAWIPFGGGPRRCIGMAFALLEMRVVLAALFERARLRLPEKPAPVTLRSFLFAPGGGTRVTMDQRRG